MLALEELNIGQHLRQVWLADLEHRLTAYSASWQDKQQVNPNPWKPISSNTCATTTFITFLDAGFWLCIRVRIIYHGDPLFVSTFTDSAILIGLVPAIHNMGWQLPSS
jgi:hypothetical protein